MPYVSDMNDLELETLRLENQRLQDEANANQLFRQELLTALGLPPATKDTLVLARVASLFKQWQAWAA